MLGLWLGLALGSTCRRCVKVRVVVRVTLGVKLYLVEVRACMRSPYACQRTVYALLYEWLLLLVLTWHILKQTYNALVGQNFSWWSFSSTTLELSVLEVYEQPCLPVTATCLFSLKSNPIFALVTGLTPSQSHVFL